MKVLSELEYADFHRYAEGDRPVSPSLGRVIFNTTRNIAEVWDGSNWRSLGGQTILQSFTVSERPDASSNMGLVIINTTDSTVEYASGGAWIVIGIGPDSADSFAALINQNRAAIGALEERADTSESALAEVGARATNNSGSIDSLVTDLSEADRRVTVLEGQSESTLGLSTRVTTNENSITNLRSSDASQTASLSNLGGAVALNTSFRTSSQTAINNASTDSRNAYEGLVVPKIRTAVKEDFVAGQQTFAAGTDLLNLNFSDCDDYCKIVTDSPIKYELYWRIESGVSAQAMSRWLEIANESGALDLIIVSGGQEFIASEWIHRKGESKLGGVNSSLNRWDGVGNLATRDFITYNFTSTDYAEVTSFIARVRSDLVLDIGGDLAPTAAPKLQLAASLTYFYTPNSN